MGKLPANVIASQAALRPAYSANSFLYATMPVLVKFDATLTVGSDLQAHAVATSTDHLDLARRLDRPTISILGPDFNVGSFVSIS